MPGSRVLKLPKETIHKGECGGRKHTYCVYYNVSFTGKRHSHTQLYHHIHANDEHEAWNKVKERVMALFRKSHSSVKLKLSHVELVATDPKYNMS